FLRTLQNLYAVDAGFDRESVLLATLDSKTGQGRSREGHDYYWELTERLEAIPGVVAVALSDNMVFGQGGWKKTIWVDGYESAPGERQYAAFNTVGPDFFRAARIPVLQGREFTVNDRADSPPVVIVNRALAEKYFPGESALGKRFGDEGLTSQRKYEIVGVVANAKYGDLREPAQPTIYNALFQSRRARKIYLQIRTAVPAETLAPQIRQLAMDIDEGLLVYNLRTLEEQVDRSLVRDRMFTTLTGLFGVLALVLACMGLYGVTAYGVERRTNEIGIRVALGALTPHIARLVLRDMARSTLVGSLVGLLAALAIGRLIEGRLFGLTPADPATIAAAVLGLFATALIACYRPVRKATRVDAAEALRHE
ncbi:MAG: ABC transporter permease, partial [bacterium]|nr:ABC transporter permease [bacterium]